MKLNSFDLIENIKEYKWTIFWNSQRYKIDWREKEIKIKRANITKLIGEENKLMKGNKIDWGGNKLMKGKRKGMN